jgi:hypothetical protein
LPLGKALSLAISTTIYPETSSRRKQSRIEVIFSESLLKDTNNVEPGISSNSLFSPMAPTKDKNKNENENESKRYINK